MVRPYLQAVHTPSMLPHFPPHCETGFSPSASLPFVCEKLQISFLSSVQDFHPASALRNLSEQCNCVCGRLLVPVEAAASRLSRPLTPSLHGWWLLAHSALTDLSSNLFALCASLSFSFSVSSLLPCLGPVSTGGHLQYTFRPPR